MSSDTDLPGAGMDGWIDGPLDDPAAIDPPLPDSERRIGGSNLRDSRLTPVFQGAKAGRSGLRIGQGDAAAAKVVL